MAKESHGKRYRSAVSLVERERSYGPAEAVELVKKLASAKFDETVELHLRTTADPRQAEQQVRGVAVLPHGLGRPIRLLVFAQGENARVAQEAGAEYAGDDELIQRIEGGWMEFDVAMATPDMMGKIGRLGRIIGRRGLMPNPRTGTVVQPQDLANAVRESKKGRVEFRLDRTSIIHSPIGKVSFEPNKLVENLAALMDAISQQKPSAIKGQFIKTAYLTSSMGPSVPLELASTLALRVD
jgi:large subunit ribosomal protein L1